VREVLPEKAIMNTTERARRAEKILLVALTTFSALAAYGDDVTDAARKQGLAKAPEIVKASGIACTVTDARRIPARAVADSDVSSGRGPPASASNGGGHNAISGASAGGAVSQTFTLELDYGAGRGFTGPAAEVYEVACRPSARSTAMRN
jgi:hypothetical protein